MRAWAVATGVALAAVFVALGARGEVGGPDEPAPADAGLADVALEDVALEAAVEDAGALAVAPSGPSVAIHAGGADAGPADIKGFAFALHGGIAFPFGSAKNSNIEDVLGYSIPIGVDVGYFITPHLYVGGYFIYGFAVVSNTATETCPVDEDCSAQQFRFGVNAAWRFRPKSVVDPWAGVLLGYDIVNLIGTDSTGATVESSALNGLELGLQTGLDIRPAPFWGFGPYVELTGGHYWFDGVSLHGWLTGGLRLFTLLSGF